MEGAENNTERLLLASSVEVRLLDKSAGLDQSRKENEKRAFLRAVLHNLSFVSDKSFSVNHQAIKILAANLFT